jgi:nitrile hydratase accessory protein
LNRPPDDPVFDAPWQAEAFAIVVALHQRGLFSWPEWAETLGAEIKSGDPYYDCWLRALETMLRAKSVATEAEIDQLTEAWHRAAHATPHGKPILLENDPQYAG